MPTITKSIGTTSRDYSTITAWEADLDNSGVYTSGDDAVGECYNDAAFDESTTINGGGTVGLSSVTLSVADSDRHDGTEGSGARIVRADITSSVIAVTGSATITRAVDWLEMDANGGRSDPILNLSGNAAKITVNHAIVHGSSNAFANDMQGIVVSPSGADLLNSIVYDVSLTNTGSVKVYGVWASPNIRDNKYLNNTIHDIQKSGSSGEAYCLYLTTDSANETARNVIATDASGGASAACFNLSSPASAVMSHNLSSDATASGTGSLTSKTASNQFVSVVSGSEDLHLKTGADAIDAGTDLGTTPSGVEIDINGRDRDASGDTWDIGAHEFVAAGGATSSYYNAFLHSIIGAG